MGLISAFQYLNLQCTLLKFRFHHVPITLVINIHILFVVKVVLGQISTPSVPTKLISVYLDLLSTHSKFRFHHVPITLVIAIVIAIVINILFIIFGESYVCSVQCAGLTFRV